MSNRVLLESIVAKIGNGIDAEQIDQPSDGMLPISRIETIWDGVIDFERVKYAQVTKAEIDKYALQSGDILFSHINSPTHIGKTAIYRSDQTLIHGINLLLIRVDQKKCYPEYLNYYFKSDNVRALFRARCKKAVNQASLNQPDVLSLEIPLPPLAEQKRIASLLARADRLRQLRRAANALADSLLQSVFLEMFGDIDKNPQHFPEVTLEEIASKTKFGIVDGPFGSHLKAEEYTNTGVRVIRVNNIKPNRFNFEDIRYISPEKYETIKRSTVRPNDIIMAKVGNTIGKACVFPKEIEFAVLTANVCKITVDSKFANPVFLSYQMNFYVIQERIKNLSGDTAKPMINIPRLKELKLLLPPLALQEEFARVVARVESLRARMAESERQAQNLFESLLAQSFGG
jgi:type I restriction enzyme S subunit